MNEIESILDTLMVNNAQNIAHLKVLEQGLLELATALLPKDQAENFEVNYLISLETKSSKAIQGISDSLYNSKAAFHAEFEAVSSIRQRLKELNYEG